MALHRLTALALTGVLALGASGCGGDSPSPTPGTSSAAASPTPTSSGPAAPVLPKAAITKTANGAEAFTKYWFALVTYAMRSGDTKDLRRSAAPECRGCNALIGSVSRVYADGHHISGGGWLVEEIARDTRVVMPYERFAVSVQQPRSEFVDEHGKVLSRGHRERFVLAFSVLWRNGRWLAYESVLTK
ncbi:hypothetical protein GCM10011584_00880 [Nocardioides phosphati]|uniref:DUF6318 domain-containing protein n=1 Tax=Nocardioides phosphati TaxID=1867775 RepID=A0ABQ2N4J9_9ACTN|nr:DUF6318 family protein [Nocardioides phosphati]GGO84107.1 hypothetical protein GCM10011584_00880 [Nocardioides phosphati]